MAPKIYMTVGISGSGKSKFADFIKKSLQATEINADNIRTEFTGSVSDQSKNSEVYGAVGDRTTAELAGGHNVFLSNTNLHLRSIKDLRRKYPHNEIVVFVMEDAFDKQLCYERVLDDIESGINRSNVPKEVIDRQHKNFLDLVGNLENYNDKKVTIKYVTTDFEIK